MSPPTELSGARLLIVDDTPQNLRLISDLLAEQGFELMLTRSGAQALEKVHLARPDLVLLDVRMPNVNGEQFCRFIKRNDMFRAIRVIFCSGDARERVEKLVAECGADVRAIAIV